MNADSDWQPSASLPVLKQRAELLAEIRAFFASREVLEVETPILSSCGNTDPNIDSLRISAASAGMDSKHDLFLATSPEYPMKRLLAAGSGSIYQICKVFRRGEAGRLHNPEFTMLEWYRPGYDYHQLMAEVGELLAHVLATPSVEAEFFTYAEVFERVTGLDPHCADISELSDYVAAQGLNMTNTLTERDGWLDLIMGHFVGPTLGHERPVFVYDYPASQAVLACIRAAGPMGEPAVAERFELYMNGVELANGYHELRDADEQHRRFISDLKLRAARGQDHGIPVDHRLIEALQHGMPACSGVAMGLDRLLMLKNGNNELQSVVSFDIGRA